MSMNTGNLLDNVLLYRVHDADWWRHADIWDDDSSISRPTEAAAVASVRLQARAPRGVDAEWYACMCERYDDAVDRAQRDAARHDSADAAQVAACAAETAETPVVRMRRRSQSAPAPAAAPVTRSLSTVNRTRPRGRRYRNGVLVG